MTGPVPPPAAPPGPPPGPRARWAALAGRWRNTAFSAADHLWLLLLWTLSTPVFITTLGERTFGIWILINALIGLNGVMSFGFGEATMRFVAQYRARDDATAARKVTEISALMFLGTSLCFAVGVWAGAARIAASVFDQAGDVADPSILALRLAAVALVVTAFLKTWESAINGCERFDVTARIGMVTRSFIILGNVALALAGFGLPALLAVSVLGLAGQALALFVVARRFLPGLRPMGWAERPIAIEVLRYGLQSWLQICAGAMSNIVDRFVVAAMIDPAAAGVYAVCLQLAQQIHLLLYRGLAWQMPAASRDTAVSADLVALTRSYRAGMILTLILVGSVALPLFVLAPQVLTVWVGAEFAARGTIVLQMLLVYFSVLGLGVPAHFLVNGTGLPGWNSVSTLLHGTIILGAAVALLPLLGLAGIGVARLLALPTLLITFYALHRKALDGEGGGLTLGFAGGLAALLSAMMLLEPWMAAAVPPRLGAVIAAGLGLALVATGLIVLPAWAARRRRAGAAAGRG